MAKALELSADTLTAPPVPKAAQIVTQTSEPRRGREARAAAKTEPREPLQVRWPGDEVKAAKLAAIQLDFPTVSDFMLACFHAYMKTHKQA
jgi:hypothetical protein